MCIEFETFRVVRSVLRDRLVHKVLLDRSDYKVQEAMLAIQACPDNQAIQPTNKDRLDHLDRLDETAIQAILDRRVIVDMPK